MSAPHVGMLAVLLAPALAGCAAPVPVGDSELDSARTFAADFDSVPAGGLPADWTVGSGRWAVVAAGDAPSPPRVLQAGAQDGPALVWLPTAMAREFELLVALDVPAGTWAGVAVGRFANGTTTLVRVDPADGRAELVVVARDGGVAVQAERSFAPLGGWRTLGVAVEDGDVGVSLDGENVLTADGYPAGARIGLWAEGPARFDDVSGETE